MNDNSLRIAYENRELSVRRNGDKGGVVGSPGGRDPVISLVIYSRPGDLFEGIGPGGGESVDRQIVPSVTWRDVESEIELRVGTLGFGGVEFFEID